MMVLTLTPARGLPGQAETVLSVKSDTLTVDGTRYDLSEVPEGGLAMPTGEHPFVGTLTRINGAIHATVRVVLGDTAAPTQSGDPWVVEVKSGQVTIPALRVAETEAQEVSDVQP